MDDRDKDLTHLFVRDLDEIPLPPRGAWRRAPGKGSIAMRASRVLLAAAAIAAVLAVALIVGFQLSQRQQSAAGPSSSARPSDTSLPFVDLRASASPSGTPCLGPCGGATGPAQSGPAAGALYNDDFGFLVGAGDIPAENVRKESTGAPLGTITSVTVAVSPDGKQVAFFVPDVDANKLEVALAAEPAKAQVLVTLGAGVRGGGIAWSSDGAGLLYATERGSFGVTGGPNYATLNMYELAANGRHGTVIDAQTNTGFRYWPIAWDRSVNRATAGLTGESGDMAYYVTALTAGTPLAYSQETAALGIRMSSVRASSDANYVLGVVAQTGGIRWWPLVGFALGKQVANSLTKPTPVGWRPGSHEIGWVETDQIFLFNVDLYAYRPLIAAGGLVLRAFRADGSALLLANADSGGTGGTYALVRLSDGARVPIQEAGFILASVRLR